MPTGRGTLILRVFLALLTLLGCCVVIRSLRPIREAWGIPEPVLSIVGQLKALELPRDVERIDWLGTSRLEALDVSNCAIKDQLSGAPPGLKVLIARNLQIRQLSGLPARLEHLDIRGCDLTSIGKLPATMQVLAVGGMNSKLSVTDLPGKLRKLIVENMDPAEFPEYPADLSELSII